MKRNFSKMLSIMLVAIMVLSLVQLPASAAGLAFCDAGTWVNATGTIKNRNWVAPYGDELAHGDFSADDGTGTAKVTYALTNDTNSASIDPDGIVCINKNLNASAGAVVATAADGTTLRSGMINYVADSPFIHNFDTDPFCLSNGNIHDTESDASTVIFQHAGTKTVGNNTYMVSSDPSENYVDLINHTVNANANSGSANNVIMIADVNLSASNNFSLMLVNGTTKKPILQWNRTTGAVSDPDGGTTLSSTANSGWHTIKLMLSNNLKSSTSTSPYRATYGRYAIFFDDELLTATTQSPINLKTGRNIRFEGMEGIDNFKLYGSDTPHAHNVGLDRAPKSGGTVGGSASMHSISNYINDETRYIYSYYVSDTKDASGTYTKVTSKDKTQPLYLNESGRLVINEDFTGYHIKVGARVWNRGGMSPEVMSKQIYEIEGYEDGFVPDYVFWSAEEESGANITQIAGKTAKKWGPFTWGPNTNDVTKPENGLTFNFPQAEYKYKHLVIEMYSAKKTYHPFNLQMYTQQTAGGWYLAPFSINWEGGWKQIKFLVSGGLDGKADFEIRKTPNFKPYQTNRIQINAHLNTSSRFYEDTEVYISKIYFEGEGIDETVVNDNGEIILPTSNDTDTMTDYVSMLQKNHPNKHHPRLVVTDEKIDFLKGVINSADSNTDSNVLFIKQAFKNLQGKADEFVTSYSDDTKKGYSDFEEIIKTCGLMHLLTYNPDDPATACYADLVWKEVDKMIKRTNETDANGEKANYWTDNNTGLNCAHISNGMALAYDWCYDYLTDAQKLAIRNALMEYSFEHFLIKTRNGAGYMNHRNNVVAADSKGLMTALLAICDEEGYKDFCNEMINILIENVPNSLEHQFLPDGTFSEGASYWRYTVYSLMFMTDAMLTSIGSDGGIQDMPGLSETGYYPFALRGSSGSLFNFSDSVSIILQNLSPVYHYLSDRYNIPALRAYRLDLVNEKLEDETKDFWVIEIEDLLWFNPEISYNSDWRSLLPKKDFFLDGLAPIISMRSGYELTNSTDNNLYIAAKAGNPKVGHCQYDAGSFVLDANGYRWILDPGGEKYGRNLPTYDYYRVRAEGNNCLVFDPEREDVGQTIAKNEYDTRCEIVDAGTSENNAYSVMDLKPSYKEKVESYKRGYAIVNNRSQVIVQDEFTTKDNKPSEIYSYFHVSNKGGSTYVKATVNADGKSLTLQHKNSNRRCRVDFITDIKDFDLGFMEAEHHTPLTGVSYDGYKNDEFKKFYFHAENVTNATITVVFTPLGVSTSSVSSPVPLPEIKPIANWGEYLENKADTVVINSIDEGKVNITAKWNFNKANKNIILAAYKNDALVGVKSISGQIENKTKDYTVQGFEPGEYDTLKAFVWDDMSSTLKPVCQKKEEDFS